MNEWLLSPLAPFAPGRLLREREALRSRKAQVELMLEGLAEPRSVGFSLPEFLQFDFLGLDHLSGQQKDSDLFWSGSDSLLHDDRKGLRSIRMGLSQKIWSPPHKYVRFPLDFLLKHQQNGCPQKNPTYPK